MTRGLIGVCLALAAITLATAVAHGVMSVAAGAMRMASWRGLGARTRAGLLLQARLAPLTLSLGFVLVVELAFWAFEPATASEHVGLALPTLALAGLCLATTGLWRGVVATRSTRRLAAIWRQSAEPHVVEGWQGAAWLVRTRFPLVAVVGFGRAELFVSTEVQRACSPRELEAIAAHERAHVGGRDNLTRLLLTVTPGLGPAAARLEQAWDATAEELADMQSRTEGDGVTLARALTKVARLVADAAEPRRLAISTLIGAGSLETRVRRLLVPPAPPGPRVRAASAMAVTTATLGAALWGLPAIYDAAELLVRLGR